MASKLTTINGQLPLLVINNLSHLIIRRDKMDSKKQERKLIEESANKYKREKPSS